MESARWSVWLGLIRLHVGTRPNDVPTATKRRCVANTVARPASRCVSGAPSCALSACEEELVRVRSS